MAASIQLRSAPTADDVLNHWSGLNGAPADRLGRFLTAVLGTSVAQSDTLGGRNIRLMVLHNTLIGRGIDARVTCGACGTPNEFEVPAATIALMQPPHPDAQVSLVIGGQTLAFRVPRYGDLAMIGGDPRLRIAAACLLNKEPIPDLSDDDLSQLAAGWETLDPAGSITVTLCCVGCQSVFDAAVDPAVFVARELDLFSDALLRDIDCIASHYGWPEAAILALPPRRRLRYVALIQGQGGQTPLREVRR
jgi:hypothetical protein